MAIRWAVSLVAVALFCVNLSLGKDITDVIKEPKELEEIHFLNAARLAAATPKPCPDGWTYAKNFTKCFKNFDKYVDWATALQTCRTAGADLPSVHSDAENKWILNTFPVLFITLGLQRVGAAWKWTDGSAVTYTNWGTSTPPSSGAVEISSSAGQWDTWSASSPGRTICQKPAAVSPCLDGWTYAKDFGKCFKNFNQYVGWNSALTTCRNAGADLPSVHSASENAWIFANFPVMYVTLGLKRTNGKWSWSDGTVVNYTNWAANAPNTSPSDYAEISTSSGQWKTWTVSVPGRTICQMRAAGVAPPSTPPPPKAACRAGWTLAKDFNKCFKNFHNNVGWATAKKVCSDNNAQLPSVHSAAENKWIVANFPLSYITLGLNKASGTWKWSDGSTYNYTNWAVNQPSGGSGNYAEISSDGRWTAWSATSPAQTVCQTASNQ